MSKPGTLAILKHGVLLCGKTFKTFVETFNWVVDCLRNIQGDYDISPSTGRIQVTGVSDGRPVIRYVAPEKEESGGTGTLTGNAEGSSQITLDGAVIKSDLPDAPKIKTFADGSTPTIYITESGVKADEASIVKDTASGVLSVAGFADAAANTVPVKTSDGAVEWKEAAGGKVTGNTADSVEISLSGAVFRTADDSNVQIKTYMDGETPVIQIGVYYK